MKLKSAVISALFLFSAASVQAATDTPDILSTISPSSVQTLSKEESAETRGEYRYCTWAGRCTPWYYSFGRPNPVRAGYDFIQQFNAGFFYVSR
jgi:hypothetical protein